MVAPRNATGPAQQVEGAVIGVQLVPCRFCGSEMPSVYLTSVMVNTAPSAYREAVSVGDVQDLSQNADGAAPFADIQFRVPYSDQNQLVMLDQCDVFSRQTSLPQSQTPAASSYTADELRILHRIIML